MQAHAGVFRTDAVLREGLDKLDVLEDRLAHAGLRDTSRVFNTARIEALELENLIGVARATLVSAIHRTESRGAHTREDFPAARRRALAEAHAVFAAGGSGGCQAGAAEAADGGIDTAEGAGVLMSAGHCEAKPKQSRVRADEFA